MADTSVIVPWQNGVPYGAQAGAINQFMTNQAILPYMANLPNYANMVGQRSQNTSSMLRGELPQDVVNQIAQGAAERGIGAGVSASPNSSTALLRALGLSSLDVMGRGSQELSQSIADTPVPELWNPAQLWVPSVQGQQQQEAAARGFAAQQATQTRADQAASWNAKKPATYSTNYVPLFRGF